MENPSETMNDKGSADDLLCYPLLDEENFPVLKSNTSLMLMGHFLDEFRMFDIDKDFPILSGVNGHTEKQREHRLTDGKQDLHDVINPSYYRTSGDSDNRRSKELNGTWLSYNPVVVEFAQRPTKEKEINKFLCEDERYKADLLLELTSLMVKRAKDVLEGIINHRIETSLVLGDHFTVTDILILENLYGDAPILEELTDRPLNALPVIITRINQQLDKLTRLKTCSFKTWADKEAKKEFNLMKPKTKKQSKKLHRK